MPDNKPASIPRKANKEIGVSGTIIYHGLINSEEYNRTLTGVTANKTYEIMRRSDSTIRSALQVVKLPILSANYTIKAPKSEDGKISEEYQERADFIERELFHRNVNWHQFLKAAVTHFDFGFSVFEKVLGITEFNGKVRIGIDKLASRKQISIYKWEMTDGGKGIVQQVGNGDKFDIPWEKLLIFSHDKEGDNYEGTSLLRYVYKDWDIKDKLTIVNAMSLEKQGMGIPVVTARDNQEPTPDDENEAVDVLSNLRANEQGYLKVPKTMQVEMLDMKGQTTKEIIPSINYHDGRIMTGVLARFMELGGASGSGSQSLSKDLSSLFMKAEEGVAKEIVGIINEHLIKPLCDMNFLDNSDGYPELTVDGIDDDDVAEIADAVAALMNAGAITADADLENHVRKRLALPDLTEERKDSYDDDLAFRRTEGPAETKPAGNKSVDKKTEKELKEDETVEAALTKASEYRAKLVAKLQGA
jgi:phage gp29-like protein